jgi:hypothetical protein
MINFTFFTFKHTLKMKMAKYPKNETVPTHNKIKPKKPRI